MLSVGIAETEVICATNEYPHFDPLNATWDEYMKEYKSMMGGYLRDESAISNCGFYPINDTNVFPDAISVKYSDVWRSLGIMWVYIAFNTFAAYSLYW